MKYSLGLDIGSVSAKIALVGEDGKVVHLDFRKTTDGPRIAVNSLLAAVLERFPAQEIVAAGVSGCGASLVPQDLGWCLYTSPLSIAAGVLRYYPQAKTVVQVGGQTSLVITMEDGLKKPWKVDSNPLCAAGTGRFIEQQAYRLGISVEDFARLALEYKEVPPRIAVRCSVFAKSDLIHLQQKGVPLAAMLKGLSDSIARMVFSLHKGILEEPVYFVGGVAANGSVVKSFEEVISASYGHQVSVVVPDNYLYTEAIGSALLSRASGKSSRITILPESDVRQEYLLLPRLKEATGTSTWTEQRIAEPFKGYLGVDVGSTSTKGVIMDEAGKRVMAKHYLMTAGRPLDAVKEVFRNLYRQVGDNACIAGVGVTGSGRYLVGSYIGADLIKNEITAQTRAAAEVDPEADIIEIGGQDSKLVIKRNGVVVDYQMNKACAAGTGSFLDELAEQLGVSVKNGDFASLAFKAENAVDLGSRCAAFMGQAVATAQQEGIPLEVITASLANSIAGNYLSKVVGHRHLGNKVILTGAVFYNMAVVSAFKNAMSGKSIIVPEHKEVTGAIGSALLAREQMIGRQSSFKGFQTVIESNYTLSTFTCGRCENNCTISCMKTADEMPTFYGSRCDYYDSSFGHEKKETAFEERESLLFKAYVEGSGHGPTVGIPRALMVYDYAPLLLGFLKALDVKVVLSSKTNKHIMEQAAELSYADSCFPVKLLHGHAANLSGADFILFPCAIRLGSKDGDENQKYSCPLVQAAPFIIRQVLDLQEKALIPILDFSLGNDEVIANLTGIAGKLGFSRNEGHRAALSGLETQREFEKSLVEKGAALLRQVRDSGQLGVVLFARSYVSQDSGANMGIAEKLAQLGVVPIPLDYLPLDSVDIKKYSDRPYWVSESKHIAGAAITAADPSLYGLALTNFGCGPNSFILNIVEDIMGGKPLGQLEIDEHAAEAGIVTRLEAFVDTIQGYHKSARVRQVAVPMEEVYRGSLLTINRKKVLLVPRMSAHSEVFCAAAEAYGAKAITLPEPDDKNLLYSNSVTSGKECLPYRVTLGDFIRFFRENGHSAIDIGELEGFMAGSFGPCRLGKYALEQIRVLRELGFDIPIRTTVSNNGYRDVNLGRDFELLAWKGLVAVDFLDRMVRRSRPYEKKAGDSDQLYSQYLSRIVACIRTKDDVRSVLKDAGVQFRALVDRDEPRRPLVGINGEIFLRLNRFSNKDLERTCEKAGLEVVVSSMGEWVEYIYFRGVEDAVKEKKLKKILVAAIKRWVLLRNEHAIGEELREFMPFKEPSTQEILKLSGEYLSPRCGSEAVLSIGAGIEWMENPRFAGVISVMPHGCMPGGIVAAMSSKFSTKYNKPWLNLTYDGFPETSNLAKVNSFAELIRFCHKEKKPEARIQ